MISDLKQKTVSYFQMIRMKLLTRVFEENIKNFNHIILYLEKNVGSDLQTQITKASAKNYFAKPIATLTLKNLDWFQKRSAHLQTGIFVVIVVKNRRFSR